jgi:hypothetical protein
VALVRDTPRLRGDWAGRIAAFNDAFNPYQDGKAAARLLSELETVLAAVDAGGGREVR